MLKYTVKHNKRIKKDKKEKGLINNNNEQLIKNRSLGQRSWERENRIIT